MFKYCLYFPKLQPEIPAAVTTDTDVQCATRGKPQMSFRPKMAHCTPRPGVCWTQSDVCVASHAYLVGHMHVTTEQPVTTMDVRILLGCIHCSNYVHPEAPGFETTRCPEWANIGPQYFAMLYRAGDASSLVPSRHSCAPCPRLFITCSYRGTFCEPATLSIPRTICTPRRQ